VAYLKTATYLKLPAWKLFFLFEPDVDFCTVHPPKTCRYRDLLIAKERLISLVNGDKTFRQY
jgi:hypothetical protein